MRAYLPKIIQWLAFAFAVFQIYTAGFSPLPSLEQRAVHIMFGFTLILLSLSFRRTPQQKVPFWDFLMIGVVLAANINIFFVFKDIFITFAGTTKDFVLGGLLLLVVIETVRRAQGKVIPILLGLALLYMFVAPYIPGTWGFRGLPVTKIINTIYYSPHGIYGFLTGLSAGIIGLFIIFGSFLLHTGGGETFIKLALRLTGKYRGGPAKVAVVASGMFGTISGSAVANVAVTGNYTIPLMKRLGYKPQFAGAVEATASTGGHIMPPIMASGAFIMAELLGIPYIKIAFYALIPALLFYITVFSSIHFEALRTELVPVPEEELPSWRSILSWRQLGPLFIPLILLITLLVNGFHILTAGFYTMMVAIVLFLFIDFSPTGLKRRFVQIGTALSEGGKALSLLVPVFVCVNVLLSVLSLSGITIKLSELVFALGGETLIGALIVSAIIPIILGMGVPGAAAYVLAVAVIASALYKLGFQMLPIHMFLFYFASLCSITPPVCLACFIAARIAETDWLRLALIAVRLAAVGFIIPFFFIGEPALLALDSPFTLTMATSFSGAAGAILVAAGFFGYFLRGRVSIPVRLLFVISGVLLLHPAFTTDFIGLAVAGFGFIGDPLVKRLQGPLVNFLSNFRRDKTKNSP